MKILWICNTIFPDLSEYLGVKKSVSGSWMFASAERLKNIPNIEIGVVSTHNKKNLYQKKINKVDYYLIPYKNPKIYDSTCKKYWEMIIEDFEPDIIHIHGTEYAHGLSCLTNFKKYRYIISIQGLISICAKYYLADLKFFEIIKNITLRDLIKRDTLFQSQAKFQKRGLLEVKYFNNCPNIIGRTNWDYIHTKYINPNINYYHCNEILRKDFYLNRWDYGDCIKQRIFVSQGSYPLKGLHFIINAVNLLKLKYNNIELIVAGESLDNNTKYGIKYRNGYSKYIHNLIDKFQLNAMVKFIGPLSEKEMIGEYKKCNVFVSASSIENSSNSISEAQIMGVPVIASYVGGNKDLIEDNKSGILYRYDDSEELAESISRVFTSKLLCSQLSSEGVKIASIRHDVNSCIENLVTIYNKL